MLHKQVAKIVMDDNEGEVKVAAVAIPVADAADMTMKDQEKQGAKCCFCCCDYRRAVVAISVCYIVYYILLIILSATGAGASLVVRDVIDDMTQEDRDNLEDMGTMAIVTIVVSVLFLFFNIWTLCAALRYSTCMLSTNVCLILIQLGFNIYSYWAAADQAYNEYNVPFNTTNLIVSIVLSIIFYGLYLYPVIGLISEIKSGVMSQATYPREAYSCCCNPKKQFN